MKRFQKNLVLCLFVLFSAFQLSTQGYAIGGAGGAPPSSGGGTTGAAPGAGHESVAAYSGALLTYALRIGAVYEGKMRMKMDQMRDLFNGQTHSRLDVRHCAEDHGKDFVNNRYTKYGDCHVTKGNTDFMGKAMKTLTQKETPDPKDCLMLAVGHAANLLSDFGDKFARKNASNAKRTVYKTLTAKCLSTDASRMAMWKAYLDS